MKNYEMKFNNEPAIVYEDDSQYNNRHIEICSPSTFHTAEAVIQAVIFMEKKIFPWRFQLIVELFWENHVINEGYIGDVDSDFLKFYCESDKNLQVSSIEIDGDMLTIIMITC